MDIRISLQYFLPFVISQDAAPRSHPTLTLKRTSSQAGIFSQKQKKSQIDLMIRESYFSSSSFS